MTTTTIDTPKIETQQDWLLNPAVSIDSQRLFSADAVINAYFLGVDKGYQKAKSEYNNSDETFKILLNTFEHNLGAAKALCESFFSKIESAGFKCFSAWLRTYSLTSFDAIFLVEKSDFIKDEFLSIYSLSQSERGKINSESLDVSFTFMPTSDHLNEEKMQSDGYILKYDRKIHKS